MLVTVKAYPGLSQRHGEVVCVAGIVEDAEGRRSWGRLWPVPFRDLSEVQQFKAWQWIEMDATPSSQDGRAETWFPDADSIVMGDRLDTSQGWSSRMTILEPLMSPSICDIYDQHAQHGTSLGAFRPGSVKILPPEPNDEWSEIKRNLAAQPSLFNPTKRPLEWVPWRFPYRYWCADRPDCDSHRMTVADWGLQELFRRTARRQDDAAGREAVVVKMRQLAKRDLIFMVGNQHQRPSTFMLIGLAYPPKLSQGQAQQLGLDVL